MIKLCLSEKLRENKILGKYDEDIEEQMFVDTIYCDSCNKILSKTPCYLSSPYSKIYKETYYYIYSDKKIFLLEPNERTYQIEKEIKNNGLPNNNHYCADCFKKINSSLWMKKHSHR
jgi:hypothetical protein